MEVTFVRHGQSMGNMTNDYSTPAHDRLSSNGWQQAERLVARLEAYAFDKIYVSSLRRAWETITPYLRETGRMAEMWPELAEACWQGDRDAPAPARQSDPKRFVMDRALSGSFVARTGVSYWPPENETYREGLVRVAQAQTLLRDHHRGSDDSILVVGHEFAGSRLVEMLLNVEPVGRFYHHNTGLTRLVERVGGRFIARFVNRL